MGASEMKRMEAGEEGGGGLRTLECLRGRLLAERQASRVAKDQAELMENKLMELESKLKEETKLRKRAEKKLKLLMKKVEALKICATFEGLELSTSSENSSSGASWTSSLTSVSCPKDSEECDSKSQIAISPEEKSTSTQESSFLHSPDYHCSLGESSHGSNSIAQRSNACELEPSFYNSEPKAHDKGTIYGSDSEDYMENLFALVPVASVPEAPPTSEAASDESWIPPTDKCVGEVLDTLKLIRETLQSSIGRRRPIIIRLGPA